VQAQALLVLPQVSLRQEAALVRWRVPLAARLLLVGPRLVQDQQVVLSLPFELRRMNRPSRMRLN
jgi:hypothetical protein